MRSEAEIWREADPGLRAWEKQKSPAFWELEAECWELSVLLQGADVTAGQSGCVRTTWNISGSESGTSHLDDFNFKINVIHLFSEKAY